MVKFNAGRNITLRLSLAGLAVLVFLAAALMPPPETRAAQPGTLRKQLRNDDAPTALSAAERAELGDPMFLLVLKDNANVTSLKQVEDLIQPQAGRRKIFVVGETIMNPARGQNQERRSVITFSGSNGVVPLDNNIMLSLPFDEERFPDDPERIEALGFDSVRGRFNYYVMDRSAPAEPPSWKFRGSSEGADQLSAAGRRGTCMACHINGGPVMKELLRPWNNWHSFDARAEYLLPVANPTVRWPVATQSPRFREVLDGAEKLEGKIIASIGQFNIKRLEAALEKTPGGGVATDAQGRAKVLRGRRLLRPLFETTEFNLISSTEKSGLHPLPQVSTQGPSGSVRIPDSFFLNANLIGAGGGVTELRGLGITRARQFSQVARVTQQEYKDLIGQANTKLFGRPGDAVFAWLVPEPSQIDNDMIDRLLRSGAVSSEFVAAVLTIDLETPMFSQERASLLQFIPDEFRFVRPSGAAPPPATAPRDELTEAVIAAIEATNPAADTPAGKFLQLLRGINLKDPNNSQNPRKILESRVNAYHDRVKSNLENPQSRAAELRRLYQLALARRRAVLANPVLGALDETAGRGLLPLP